jgi:hypothetical protein
MRPRVAAVDATKTASATIVNVAAVRARVVSRAVSAPKLAACGEDDSTTARVANASSPTPISTDAHHHDCAGPAVDPVTDFRESGMAAATMSATTAPASVSAVIGPAHDLR